MRERREKGEPPGDGAQEPSIWKRDTSQDHVIHPRLSRPPVRARRGETSREKSDRIIAGLRRNDEWWKTGPEFSREGLANRFPSNGSQAEVEPAPGSAATPHASEVHMDGATARVGEAVHVTDKPEVAGEAETRENILSRIPTFKIVDPSGRQRIVYADEYLELLQDDKQRTEQADELRAAGQTAEADALEAAAPINHVLNPYRVIRQQPMLLGVHPQNEAPYLLKDLRRLRRSEPAKYAELVRDKQILVHGIGLVDVTEAVDAMENVHHGESITAEAINLVEAIDAMQRAQGNRLVRGIRIRVEGDREEVLAHHRAKFAAYAAKYGLPITDDGLIMLYKSVQRVGGRLVSATDQNYTYQVGRWHTPRELMVSEMAEDGGDLTVALNPKGTGLYAGPLPVALAYGDSAVSDHGWLAAQIGLGRNYALLKCWAPIDQSAIERTRGRFKGKVRTQQLYVEGIVR